jgi:hypothetical protein
MLRAFSVTQVEIQSPHTFATFVENDEESESDLHTQSMC